MISSTSRPALVFNGQPLNNPYAGLGTYTLRLLRGLAKADRVPFKVLLPQTAEAAAALLPEGCAIVIPGHTSPLLPAAARVIYWMEKTSSFAIQNFPEAIFHSPGLFWSRRHPARTVVTLHDCIYRRFPFYLGRLPFRKWLAYASERYAARADLVLTVSETSARDLRDLAGIPGEKIRVIHQGIEDRFNPELAEREAPGVRDKYQLPPEFILYLGGYDYRKNVEFLIEAYALAKKRGALPPLVLAGKLPEKVDRTLCDVHGAIRRRGLKVGADVFLPGRIEDADMPGLYGAAGLLVYPSRYEGFGLPPAEAMAVGTPVLVADNSSLKEVVTSPGNRFPINDSGPLVDLLVEASHDSRPFLCALDPRSREESAIEAYLKILVETFPGSLLSKALG